MTKSTKTLLAISLTSFAIGFTKVLWGFGTPVGAVFFGLFMISKLLEKEVAFFDEEQRASVALAERQQAPVFEDSRTCAGDSSRLRTASHSA
jgi:hypothetical protein